LEEILEDEKLGQIEKEKCIVEPSMDNVKLIDKQNAKDNAEDQSKENVNKDLDQIKNKFLNKKDISSKNIINQKIKRPEYTFFRIPRENITEKLRISNKLLEDTYNLTKINKKRLCIPDFEKRFFEENRLMMNEENKMILKMKEKLERNNDSLIGIINVDNENRNNLNNSSIANEEIVNHNKKQSFIKRINNMGKNQEEEKKEERKEIIFPRRNLQMENNNKINIDNFNNNNNNNNNDRINSKKKFSLEFFLKNKKVENKNNKNISNDNSNENSNLHLHNENDISNNFDNSKDLLNEKKHNKIPEKLKGFFSKRK